MEQFIVMIIFGIFFAIWKVIENANVPAGKPPIGNNRPQRETTRQKLQGELEKFLREVNSDNPPKQEKDLRSNNSGFDAVQVVEEKTKPRTNSPKTSKKTKQEPKPVSPSHPQITNKPLESQIKSKLPPSKLSTVESHVQSYMAAKIDSNVAEHANAHLKPFATHISGEAPKNIASKYDDYGSSTPKKVAPIIQPSQIFDLMNDQDTVRNAIILSEILKRPDFTRFKKTDKPNN